ncbi:MAG: hypothetical protein HYT88_00535 [Candidatus Omnitrophica bacterium]|nr:hypothetical protein [Candidatus Omnitrophota bacterium]
MNKLKPRWLLVFGLIFSSVLLSLKFPPTFLPSVSAAPTIVFPAASWDTSKTPAEVGLDESILNQFVAAIGGVSRFLTNSLRPSEAMAY